MKRRAVVLPLAISAASLAAFVAACDAGDGSTLDASGRPTAGREEDAGARDAGDRPMADAAPPGDADAAPPPPKEIPYENPVLAGDFPDPAIVRAKDRKFYAFATGLQRAVSPDLVHWTRIGAPMSKKPSWASNKNNFWAPDIQERGGTYYLYFSAEQNAGTGSFCIGVATATAPDADFVDVGKPIVCGPSFENIDPMVFDDPATGKPYLYWGSAEKPIRYRELAPNRTELAAGSVAKNILVPTRLPYERLIEAPWIHPANGFFYAFYSGDDCCGNATNPPHYAVLVARAKSPLGPFEDLSATNNTILVADDRWNGPGHNAVVTDDAGQDWIVYHAFDKTKPGGRNMLIDRITYENGWPVIATRTPSEGPQRGPKIALP